MATATGTGPIAIGQINSTLYAGEPGFPTIQYCVDFARNQGGYWLVTIPHGYSMVEPFPTGGTASIYLMDLRLPSQQLYGWDGTKFAPADFAQLGGISAPYFAASSNIPFAQDGHFYMDYLTDTGRLIAKSTTAAIGHIQLEGLSNDADGRSIVYLDCLQTPTGSVQSVFNTPVGVNGQLQVVRGAGPDVADLWLGRSPIDQAGSKGIYLWTKTAENAIDLQGITYPATYDQTIRINYFGGDTHIGNFGSTTIVYSATVIGGELFATGGLSTQVAYIGEPHNQGPGKKYMLLGTSPTTDTVQIQGQTSDGIYNQTLQLNPSGGNVNIGSAVTIDHVGNLTAANAHITGDLIVDGEVSADSASFMTCLVDNSPVRTFANSSDGGGMQFPPAGIGVSTGTAWDDNSIDPATVPRTNTNNTFTGYLAAQNLIATGAAAVTIPQSVRISSPPDGGYIDLFGPNPATQAILRVRVASSDGSLFTPLLYGDKDSLNAPILFRAQSGLAVTGNTDISGNLSVSGLSTLNANLTMKTGTSITTQFIDGTTGSDVYFNWYKGTGVTFGNGAGLVVARVDAAGKYAIPASVVADATPPVIRLDLGINNVSGTNYPGSFQFTTENSPNSNADLAKLTIKHYSGDAAFPIRDVASFSRSNATFNGNVRAAGYAAAFDASKSGIQIGMESDGVTPSLRMINHSASPNQSRVDINSSWDAFKIVFENDDGSGGVNWLNITRSGSTPTDATVTSNFNVTGNIYASGTISCGGTKAFRVPHPLDETKDLIHACLEGPENGVFYRGEVVTANGTAEVTLPDYFEALTYPEDRSVLLTVIVDDANPVFGAGQIAAGRVKDGKFKVYSSDPSVTIAWEVKAVRRINVDRLKVVTDKPEPQPLPTLQDEKTEA